MSQAEGPSLIICLIKKIQEWVAREKATQTWKPELSRLQ